MVLLAALATATVLLAGQSRRLCHHWHDNVSFFTFQLVALPSDGAKAQAHFRLGSELARRGDHANAAIQYQAAKEAYPAANIATLPYRHAESLYALGRFAEAADRYREAAALRPEAYEIWYGLALSLVRLGQLHEAADICRMAATRHPEVPEFREELERITARLNR
jgi:tetratricopeptide (TPR) repeat protein